MRRTTKHEIKGSPLLGVQKHLQIELLFDNEKNTGSENLKEKPQLNSYNEYLRIPGNNIWLHLTETTILITQHTI